MPVRIGGIPYYKEKIKLYRFVARKPNNPGPPEALWYGMWNFILNDIAFDEPLLLVFPQLYFRALTANSVPALSHSTRYTDVALVDSFPNNVMNPREPLNSVGTKVLIVLEVKPKPEDASPFKAEGAFQASQLSAVNQVLHHFSMQERDSSGKVIAIAAVGDQWQWTVFERKEGATPAFDSDRAAVSYIEDHKDLLFFSASEDRAAGWSPRLSFESNESDLNLEQILTLVDNSRLFQ
jgi:hypothetical protein